MAKKQQIILTHGAVVPSGVTIARGEVLVQHAEKAVDAALHTVLNDGTSLVSFPSKDYVDTANGVLDGKIEAIGGRVKAVEDDYLKAADKTELSGAISAETSARTADVQAINAKIGTVESGKTVVDMIAAETSARTEAVAGIQGQINNLDEKYATDSALTSAVTTLEGKITAAQNAATTKVAEGADAGNNLTIVPTTGDSGDVTYTINLDDVASASGMTALASRVKTIEDAPYATQSYVTSTVSTEIAKVVASAPEDFDTLKEIADWISNDTTGAASMANDIEALKDVTEGYSGENTIKKAVDAIDTRVQTVEKDYLKAADKTELSGAISAETSARTADVQAINAKIGTVESGKTVVDMINAEVSARTEAVAGIQGQINNLDEKYATDSALTSAVATLEGKITAAQNAATTKVIEGDDNEHLAISETTGTTGSTYTITLTDVASASGMTAIDDRVKTVEAGYVNAVEVTDATFDNKIAASITSNKLTLNFESMVIDGGTY